MCMQVHDSAQRQCKQDQHYTQAVSPSCNHPNGDGWPALSTRQCAAEKAWLKAALARNVKQIYASSYDLASIQICMACVKYKSVWVQLSKCLQLIMSAEEQSVMGTNLEMITFLYRHKHWSAVKWSQESCVQSLLYIHMHILHIIHVQYILFPHCYNCIVWTLVNIIITLSQFPFSVPVVTSSSLLVTVVALTPWEWYALGGRICCS